MMRTLLPLLKSYLMPSSPRKSINSVTDLYTQLCKEIDLVTSGGGRGF